jgi:hypothetical protein
MTKADKNLGSYNIGRGKDKEKGQIKDLLVCSSS